MQWTTRLALELIGQSGLGYSFDDLEEDTVLHPYVLAVKQLTFVHLSTLYARILTEDPQVNCSPLSLSKQNHYAKHRSNWYTTISKIFGGKFPVEKGQGYEGTCRYFSQYVR